MGDQKSACDSLYLSVEDLRHCIRQGLLVGSHSHSHPILSLCTSEKQQFEINYSKAMLEELLGISIDQFSYPSGVEGAWNNDTVKALQDAQFNCAFTLGRRPVGKLVSKDRFECPRYDTNDLSLC